MNNHTKILGALVGLLILLSIEARSQDSMRVVILSPRLGAVITRGQGEQYNIFQSYVGLQKAVVYQARSDSFYVWIETRSKTGEVVYQLVPYPYNVLKMMAEKVDHYEEIAAGRYTMGDRPVELRFADSTLARAGVVPPPATGTGVRQYVWSEELPFDMRKPPRSERTYPLLRFGACVSSLRPDVAGLQSMVNTLAAQFAALGYTVWSDKVQEISGPMVWFSIDLFWTSSVGVALEVGKAGDDAASFRSVSLSLLYRLPVDLGKVVRPYVAAGVSQYSILVNQDFSHSERVGPVDTNGAYWKLTGVGIHGGDQKVGGMVTVGAELLDPFSGFVDMDFFVRYMMVPSMTIGSPWGESNGLLFSGFAFGARIMIRF